MIFLLSYNENNQKEQIQGWIVFFRGFKRDAN